jgi:hypothetical protein
MEKNAEESEQSNDVQLWPVKTIVQQFLLFRQDTGDTTTRSLWKRVGASVTFALS